MSALGRRLASRTLAAASRLLPNHLSRWARAMDRELAEIPDDREALMFASGCIRSILSLAIAERLNSFSGAARGILAPLSPSTWRLTTMIGISMQPRLLGLICGAAAVAMGMAYMIAAGAPLNYLIVNLAALVLGATAWLALGRTASARLASAGAVILALAAALLGTAFFGMAADGASRWVSVGPLSLQISLIVLPVMLILYARRPDVIGTAGMAFAALALAIQPDRAMAGVLAAGLLGLLVASPGRLPFIAAAASALAFGATLLMPDIQPAVPYVDRILYTAFDVHPLAGAAVLTGAAALVVPALILGSRAVGDRGALLAFGGCWLAVVVAAALGNYPTPLVGYGGSAVLGYLLSVALLPNGALQTKAGGALGLQTVTDNSCDQSTSELRVPHPA
jgi:cell division protein FtsW (lipid II flippase)